MPIMDIDIRYNFGEAAQIPGVDPTATAVSRARRLDLIP
jgi:hypothetical protein